MRMKIEVKRENDVIENEVDANGEYELFFFINVENDLFTIKTTKHKSKKKKKIVRTYLFRLEERKKLC